ncbi:MAG: hypothetical protein ACW98U_12145, partial [Candidatus Thorarchaeota archaeon]
FEAFDSWEEALEAIDSGRRAADQVTEKWQWEDIVPGCYVVRVAHGIPIFSEIEHDYKEVNMQGYVFGAHYSVACPLGELGDIHRSTVLAVIDKEQFDNAKARNWDVEISRE